MTMISKKGMSDELYSRPPMPSCVCACHWARLAKGEMIWDDLCVCTDDGNQMMKGSYHQGVINQASIFEAILITLVNNGILGYLASFKVLELV